MCIMVRLLCVLLGAVTLACGPAMDPASPSDAATDDVGLWVARETPGEIGVAEAQHLAAVELTVDRPDGQQPAAQLEIDGHAIPWDVAWGQKLHIAIGAGEHRLLLQVSSSEGVRTGHLSFAAARGCRLALRALPGAQPKADAAMRFGFEQHLTCRRAAPATAIPPPRPTPGPPGASDRQAVEKWLRERHDAAVNAVSYVRLAHTASVAISGSDVCLESALAELRAVERSMRAQRGASGDGVERQLDAVGRLSGRLAELQAIASSCG